MLSFHRRSIQPLIPPSTLELPLHLFTPHLYFSTCATFYSLWPVHSIYAPFSRVKRVGRKVLAHQSWQPISKDDDTDGRDDAVILYSQSTLHSLIRYRNFCTLKAYIKIYCIDFLGRRINLSGKTQPISRPNSVHVDRSRADNVQGILGAISPFWPNGGWDESRETRVFCLLNHATFR